MRLLVLIYEFPPIGGGGGRAAQDLYPALAKCGYEIKLVTSQFRGLACQQAFEGIEILRVPALRREAFKAGFLTMLAYVVTGLFVSLRLIRRWRPDLIHVHFAVPSGALAWMLSRLTGIPYILTAHLGDVPGGSPEKTGRWFRYIYPLTPPIWREAAQVVAVSEYTRQLALAHYPVDIQVIPNGVDLHSLNPGIIQVNPTPRIIFAGRFVPQKNPLQIVRSLAELRDLPWECVMLGDGPLKPEVETEIVHQGLQERFILPGWVTPEEVLTWFRKSDILFTPSLYEGLPVVGVQALALGLALVVSQVGGWTDQVEQGENGYMISLAEQSSFSTALRNLLSDQAKLHRFRSASRRIAKKFDLQTVVDSYEKLYNQVEGVR
jgi:glycosyltransferase involved in cell wall biosynthesis